LGTSSEKLFYTPEKDSALLHSDMKRLSSPESLFTPMKIPGAQKDDDFEKSKLFIQKRESNWFRNGSY